jgi:hypothetical protein
LQVGLAKVSWTSASFVGTIPALKLMHEAGWGASQPREQAAGDLRSVTSSWVLGVSSKTRTIRCYEEVVPTAATSEQNGLEGGWEGVEAMEMVR